MSDYIVNNFLPDDHKEAKEQRNCFYYNNHLSEIAERSGRIDKALVYHENASRSLKRLAELRDKHDKAWNIIKHNESKRSMDDLIQSQKVVQEQLVDVYV